VIERLTWRDGIATVLVAALMIGYASYLIVGPTTMIADNGDMAVIGFVFGFAACVVGGWSPRTDSGRPIWGALSVIALILVVVVLSSESRWCLAVLMGCIVILWLGTTLGHAGFGVHSSIGFARPPNEAGKHFTGNAESR